MQSLIIINAFYMLLFFRAVACICVELWAIAIIPRADPLADKFICFLQLMILLKNFNRNNMKIYIKICTHA